jgi:hypothetical protein
MPGAWGVPTEADGIGGGALAPRGIGGGGALPIPGSGGGGALPRDGICGPTAPTFIPPAPATPGNGGGGALPIGGIGGGPATLPIGAPIAGNGGGGTLPAGACIAAGIGAAGGMPNCGPPVCIGGAARADPPNGGGEDAPITGIGGGTVAGAGGGAPGNAGPALAAARGGLAVSVARASSASPAGPPGRGAPPRGEAEPAERLVGAAERGARTLDGGADRRDIGGGGGTERGLRTALDAGPDLGADSGAASFPADAGEEACASAMEWPCSVGAAAGIPSPSPSAGAGARVESSARATPAADERSGGRSGASDGRDSNAARGA